jgi:2,3-bisphosphoglycerate-independent phosphoglycerate mutase
MKYIILIPDGASDETYDEIGGKTPLEAAKTPNMDFLAKHGRVGLFNPIPKGMEPGSDVGHLSLFGYDPRKYYCGRAPLEAASMGVKLEPNEVAFRMNFVTESNGIMVDHSSGGITTQESRELIKFLSSKLSSEYVKFYPGVGYRHLAVLKDAKGLEGLSAKCTPPHDILGEKWEDYLPEGPGDSFLIKLIQDSKPLLENHEINRVRLDLKENPANMIWFWGQGVAPELESFEKRFGLKGAVISAVDLVNGIGKLLGWEVLRVPNITGTIDTNYEGKIEAALNSLQEKDSVVLHTEASDEAGHEGNLKLKITSIEYFDQRIVGPVRKYFEENRDTRVMIAADHNNSIRTRTHTLGEVPFLIFGNGILPNGADRYTEISARLTNLEVKEGYRLIEQLIQG